MVRGKFLKGSVIISRNAGSLVPWGIRNGLFYEGLFGSFENYSVC